MGLTKPKNSSMTTGNIEALWRFPLKSFQGEKLDHAALDKSGIVGDRAYALVDKLTGKVVSAKSIKLFPEMLNCTANYLEEPKAGGTIPPVKITLADGTAINSNSDHVDKTLSAFFGREVTLTRVAPQDFTIDQYHPDLKDLDPAGHRNTFVEQKLGAALFKEMGAESPVAPGSFMDVFPISLITTSTLNKLQELRPETNFDIRRFRMNILVKTPYDGFVENSWIGNVLAVGDEVRIPVTMPDPRCVMTTLAQDEIPKDTEVLRTLVQHNRLDIMGTGKFPCAGVYGVIAAGGSIHLGDPVEMSTN